MGHPFGHPKGKELLKRVALHFRSEQAYVRSGSRIIFVCGGPTGTDANQALSMRRMFLDFAKQDLQNFRVFLAEDAEKDYVTHDKPEFHNVAEFEEIIADVSDCLLIFPESPGSFAELGYFAKNDEIAKKTLVVHDSSRQGVDSFISRGPIHRIDQKSDFRPAIQLDYGENPNFAVIKGRIESRVNNSKRRRLAFESYASLSAVNRFFAVFEILSFFGALSVDGVVYAFKSIFGNVKKAEIKGYLSILVAAEFLHRAEGDHHTFVAKPDTVGFIDFDGFDTAALRLEIRDYYSEHKLPEMSYVAGVAI